MHRKSKFIYNIKIPIIAFIFFLGISGRAAYIETTDGQSWLDSLHEQGREIFYKTIKEEITAHPQRSRLTETEIKKIMEAEIRYDRLYGLLINVFYQKDEPVFNALMENGSDESKSRFSRMYLELARFAAHNFVECFFLTDVFSEYQRKSFPEYKGMDTVDLVVKFLGYHAKLETPEKKMVTKPLNPGFDKQGALDTAKFRTAHKMTKGKGVKIAILDSGIDESHPVFKNTGWGRHFSSVGRVGKPWAADAPVYDWTGHGTLISSVVARYAPEAQITMYKFLDHTQFNPTHQLIIQCMLASVIYKAVHDGNDVIMISASGVSLDIPYMKEACQYAYDNNRIVISGNLYHRWQRTGNNLNFPGQYDTVISVTAAEKRGDGTYGYWDVCAPDSTTTVAVPNTIFGAFPTHMEEEDTYIPSISAAIPVVAALVAMTIAGYPRTGTEEPGEYAEAIKELIIRNANPGIVGFQGFSPECGYGLIDAEKTVKNAAQLNSKRLTAQKNQ